MRRQSTGTLTLIAGNMSKLDVPFGMSTAFGNGQNMVKTVVLWLYLLAANTADALVSCKNGIPVYFTNFNVCKAGAATMKSLKMKFLGTFGVGLPPCLDLGAVFLCMMTCPFAIVFRALTLASLFIGCKVFLMCLTILPVVFAHLLSVSSVPRFSRSLGLFRMVLVPHLGALTGFLAMFGRIFAVLGASFLKVCLTVRLTVLALFFSMFSIVSAIVRLSVFRIIPLTWARTLFQSEALLGPKYTTSMYWRVTNG